MSPPSTSQTVANHRAVARLAALLLLVLAGGCGDSDHVAIEAVVFEEDQFSEEERQHYAHQDHIRCLLDQEMNNLKDIYAILRTWRNDRQQIWPRFKVLPNLPQADYPKITAQIFELLARYLPVDPDIFVSPTMPEGFALPAPRRFEAISSEADLRWASSYALDWSTPRDGDLNRIFMATRHAIEGKVVACYYDGGTQVIAIRDVQVDERQRLVTLDRHGEPLTFAVDAPMNVTKYSDDIYSNDGPGEATNITYGKGSRLRAWVK
jgi:hypothetical protein